MAVPLKGAKLKLELNRRGISQGAFALRSNLSANTISNAAMGRPVQPWVLNRIVLTLAKIPVVQELDDLIADRVPVEAA